MISQSVPADFTMVEHFGQHVCKEIPLCGALDWYSLEPWRSRYEAAPARGWPAEAADSVISGGSFRTVFYSTLSGGNWIIELP